MLHFTCPRCPARMNAPDHFAGRTATCPGCGLKIVVPQPVATLTETSLEPDDSEAEFRRLRRRSLTRSLLIAVAILVVVPAIVLLWSWHDSRQREVQREIERMRRQSDDELFQQKLKNQRRLERLRLGMPVDD